MRGSEPLANTVREDTALRRHRAGQSWITWFIVILLAPLMLGCDPVQQMMVTNDRPEDVLVQDSRTPNDRATIQPGKTVEMGGRMQAEESVTYRVSLADGQPLGCIIVNLREFDRSARISVRVSDIQPCRP